MNLELYISIISAALVIGGVLGRMSSLKEVTMLTKRTEKEQEQNNKSFDEVFERLRAVEKELAGQGAVISSMARTLERMQAILEGWRRNDLS